MRSVTLALILLAAAPAPVAAQQVLPTACAAALPQGSVTVTMRNGASLGGTLMCLADGNVWLARDGRLVTAGLADVRRIQTDPDPVWDGAAKGAAIPLIVWLAFVRDTGSANFLVRSMAAYGAIGLALDAIQTNRQTIYAGSARPSLAWRVTF